MRGPRIVRMLRMGWVLLALAVMVRADEPVAEWLTVQGNDIYPPNVAATVSQAAAGQVAAEVAAVKADAVEQAAGMVANAVSGVTEIVNSLEGVGYIRGHVLQFGSGVEADTNMVASIVKFSGAGADAVKSYWDIWTYFTEDPGLLPLVRFSDALGRTNAWEQAEQVGDAVVEDLLVGSTYYESIYRNRVSMPLEYGSAFFRVFADVTGAGTNLVYLPVRNGVAVNGTIPLTGTFITGTNAFRWVGGVRVQ